MHTLTAAYPFAASLPAFCKAAPGIKLYQFVKAGASGRWELISSRACPGFYDANQDARSKEPDFWLEVDAGDIDTRADDALSYVADPAAKRVTFAANEGLWALKFPSAESYRAFMTELEVGVVSGWGREAALGLTGLLLEEGVQRSAASSARVQQLLLQTLAVVTCADAPTA
jgi:hypothetical protein